MFLGHPVLGRIFWGDVLSSPADWRYRHAALMAISACGEGCHKQMEEMLGNIMDATLQYLQDPVSVP